MMTYARFLLDRIRGSRRYVSARGALVLAAAAAFMVIAPYGMDMTAQTVSFVLAVLLLPNLMESAFLMDRLFVRPLEDQRTASMLLLPFSRTDVVLGTFLISGLWPTGVYLVQVLTVTVLSVLGEPQLTAGDSARLGLGALLAWLTVLAIQYLVYAVLRRGLTVRVLGRLIPALAVFLAFAGALAPMAGLRLISPVTLTLPHGPDAGPIGTTRMLVQPVLGALLLVRATREFARSDLE